MSSPRIDPGELKRLTEIVVTLLNNRDFEFETSNGKELLRHLDSDFEGRFDTLPHTINFDQQLEIWKQNAKDHPTLQFSTLQVTTRLQRRSNTASVYLMLGITGMGTVRYQGSCELRWRYHNDRWLLCSHITMRGPLFDSLLLEDL